MAKKQATILIVDDETVIRRLLKQRLAGEGYQCREAGSANEALAQLRSNTVELAILDIKMPGKLGTELLPEIKAGYPDRLSGEQISLGGRILALADAYDAMTSEHPYRQARSDGAACAEIERGKGAHFDPEVADAFLRTRKFNHDIFSTPINGRKPARED